MIARDLHYCFSTVGSLEKNASFVRLRELGREMVRLGIRVSYLMDDVPGNRSGLNLPAAAKVEFVPAGSLFAECRSRRRIIRHLRPDYVHILNPSPKSFLTFAPMVQQKIVGDWDEWHAGWGGRLSPRRLRMELFERWLVAKSELAIVASRYMQDRFAQQYGRRPLYLPYATHLEVIPGGQSPFTTPTAVYMGALWSNYDQDLIFDAAVLLQKRGLHPAITILGEGPDLEKWQRFVDEHGLTNVTLPGFKRGAELWRYLSHAQVLLFPIRPTIQNLARCPSKTYSYAQARRPVITNRTGEIPSVLGELAWYVETTPQSFADAIERAFSVPSLADVDYHIEQQNWKARCETLLEALPN